MAANTVPIFPGAVLCGIARLTAATAITSRADIVGTTGLVKLTDASIEGVRIDAIRVKCKGTSVVGSVFIWLYDGTTSSLIDEIAIDAVTATATVPSYSVIRQYETMNLIKTQQLYVSESVVNDLDVFAHGGSF